MKAYLWDQDHDILKTYRDMIMSPWSTVFLLFLILQNCISYTYYISIEIEQDKVQKKSK